METLIFEDAVKAYAKYGERNGYIFSQPNEKPLKRNSFSAFAAQ